MTLRFEIKNIFNIFFKLILLNNAINNADIGLRKKKLHDDEPCCFLVFAADKNIWKFFPTTKLVPVTACL